MYTINNNEEHINNIKQMIDGKIPQKFQKNNHSTKYKSSVHKYNDICSEVNLLNSNELEYMIVFYTTQFNSTNRKTAVKSSFTIMVSFLTTIVALYIAILPNIDINSMLSFFNDIMHYIIVCFAFIIVGIVFFTSTSDKKMKKYEYILLILQNEQLNRSKPNVKHQQQKRNQHNRNKNCKNK